MILAARAEEPGAAALDRMLLAIEGTAAPATASSALLSKLLWIGALLGALGAGLVWWSMRRSEEVPPQRNSRAQFAKSAPVAPPPAESPAAAPADEHSPPRGDKAPADNSGVPGAIHELAAAERPERAEPPARTAKPAAQPTELDLIESAREALASGQHDAVLRLARVHRRRFARGLLAIEREALAIEALIGAGQPRRARRRLERLEREHPRSGYGEHLRRLLEKRP
jgi:hypothetical protein